jgi:hypothetical protein
MPSRDVEISVGGIMVAIAVVAVAIAAYVALREEPLVPDPPYVPRARPPAGPSQKFTGIRIARLQEPSQ